MTRVQATVHATAMDDKGVTMSYAYDPDNIVVVRMSHAVWERIGKPMTTYVKIGD